MKLLRVPKIYNALITTNQKLVPSEAFPASTGPVFQPLGLSGDPVLLNPEAFTKAQSLAEVEGEPPRPFAKSGKMPAPVVFYPRYNVYHQLPQSVFPYHNVYQPPPIVVPVERSQVSPPMEEASTTHEESPASEEEAAPTSGPVASSMRPAFGFVTNNSPKNPDIPNVPPPLPPVGAPRPPEEVEESSS